MGRNLDYVSDNSGVDSLVQSNIYYVLFVYRSRSTQLDYRLDAALALRHCSVYW